MTTPPSLRLAVDASRTTVARLTGTEHYALQLLIHLIQHNETLPAPHRLHLYFRDVPPDDLFPASAHVQHHVIERRRMWTHLGLARALWQTRPDVTFVPAHTLPFVFPGKAVVTVHDLGYKYFPQAHPPNQRRYLDGTTRYSARRARIVLADSRATAHDLTRFYGTPPHKIRVVYPGVDAPRIRRAATIQARYALPENYFLFIGTLQPRKNIERIVQAFHRWQAAHPQQHIGLVLAGKGGWLFQQAWVEGVPNVRLTGYIDDDDKGALLANATALVFPSLYEGFGFPVLEAMHCGTPVIASNTSSLPEVVGDAGLQVDPSDTAAIAGAMAELANDGDLRRRLAARGFEQARTFTWERAARATMRVLEAVGQGISPALDV